MAIQLICLKITERGMVVFLLFSETGLCIYFLSVFPEYCARICATKLSDFTFTHNGLIPNRFPSIYHFLLHSGLCLEKHANRFLGEVIKYYYMLSSLAFDRSTSVWRFNLFHRNWGKETSNRRATHVTESRLKGNYPNRKAPPASTAFETDHTTLVL